MKRKKANLLLSILLSILSAMPSLGQSLSGTYTVGASLGTEDYSTLSAAIADLRTGTVVGDVTYNIGVGTYNETMDLASLNNGDFNITFSGAGTGVTIIHPLDSIVADSSAISIRNTNHIVLENFTLILDDLSDNKVDYLSNRTKGINISTAQNITIDNLTISNSLFVESQATTEYTASAVSLLDVQNVTIASSTFSGAGALVYIDAFQNVTIDNSDFSNAQFHIRLTQSSTDVYSGLIIDNNTFTGPFPSGRNASAIYLVGRGSAGNNSNTNGVEITNNTIDCKTNDRNEGSYGIFISTLNEPKVSGNLVQNSCYGIYEKGGLSSLIEANEVLDAANFGLYVQNLGEGSYVNNIFECDNYAASFVFSSNVYIAHNTFVANGEDAGVYFLGISGDNFTMMNNIVDVSGTIVREIRFDAIQANSISIDYNLFSGNASSHVISAYELGGSGGITYNAASLSDWQANQALYDQNSQSFAPVFAGADDYHITNSSAYRFGSTLGDVISDIDGDYRDPSDGIDVGADQYCNPACVQVLPPTITSFSPGNGPIGTTVTIVGSNFDADAPTNNVVFFGATQAEVVSASESQVVVDVPFGASYEPITVQVDGLIAESKLPFEVTFESDGTIAEQSLATSVSFNTGTEPNETAIGDMDGDGQPDLVVINATDNSISIFRNLSTGAGDISLDDKVDLSTVGRPNDVVLTDFDGDGKLDIAVGHQYNSNVSIFRNTSSGGLSFDTRQDIDFGSDNTHSIASGDLDGDGKMDLAAIDDQNNNVVLFTNQSSIGSIGFGLFNSFATGDTPVSVVIVDMDQDQIKDVVVANQAGLSVSVLLNDGSMNLSAKVDFAIGSEPTEVVAGDIDGDGIEDLVIAANQTANNPTARIRLLRNTSTPGALSLSSLDLFVGADRVSLSDINGDGKTDILYSHFFTGFYMIKNQSTVGAISFDTEVHVLPEIFSFSISSGDLDSDGEPDVILSGANDFDDLVEIHRNLNSGVSLESFSIPEQTSPAIIDHENYTVDIDLLDCSNIKKLTASFEVTPGATVDVLGAMGSVPQTSGVTQNDFTIPLSYAISSEDGNTVQNWLVSASGTRYSDEVSENVEVCDVYEFDGNVLTTSGQYQGLFNNTAGCDSLVTLNLTILESTEGSEEVVACESYEWESTEYTVSGSYQEVLVNSVGCDSVATLNLTILESTEGSEEVVACESYEWESTEYTVSGSYQEVLVNSVGCDSVATLNLTILESTEGSEEVVACESYEWESTEYTVSGSYQEVLVNSVGCDSVATLNLTILEGTEGTEEVVACESYEWESTEYTVSGSYQEVLVNSVGCDSVATLNLTILESDEVDQEITTCESYEFNGEELTTSGNYQSTFTNIEGCDSLVNLSLTIQETYEEEIEISICEEFGFDDQLLTESGSYQASFLSQTGCDSLVTLNLTILETDHTEVILDECGDYEFGEQLLSSSGVYEELFTNQAGCDSLVTLTFGHLPEPVAEIEINGVVLFAEEQPGASYQWYYCEDNEPIEGEDKRQLTPPRSGNYYVEVDNGGCSSISECLYFDWVMSTEELQTQARIYPTVTSGQLTIELGEVLEEVQLRITNLNGKAVENRQYPSLSKEELHLNVPSGIYLIQIQAKGKTQLTEKIIVRP